MNKYYYYPSIKYTVHQKTIAHHIWRLKSTYIFKTSNQFPQFRHSSTSFYFKPIRWFHIHSNLSYKVAPHGKFSNSYFVFNDCLMGGSWAYLNIINMFNRTILNKLPKNGHIQNITAFNCDKNCANWCRYFKVRPLVHSKWKTRVVNFISRWCHLCYKFV